MCFDDNMNNMIEACIYQRNYIHMIYDIVIPMDWLHLKLKMLFKVCNKFMNVK